MKVLLVEDQAEQIETIVGSFNDGIDFAIASDRDTALALVAEGPFDLAVCDLKIPASPGGTPEIEHGLAVVTELRSRVPGTPIIAFTANRTTEVMEMLLREQRQEDYLGTLADRPMLSAIDKDQLPEFLDLLRELRDEFAELEQVQVVAALGMAPLDPLTARVLRVYARQRDCTITRVHAFTEGQSGVPVLRLSMERGDGSCGGSAVARLVTVDAVVEERRRYQQRVSGFLPIGSYAEIVGHVRAGAGALGGVFYQLAADYRSLFALLAEDDEAAASAVERLQAVQSPWREGAPAVDVPVRDVRRTLIDDARWSDCFQRCGLDHAEVEAIEAVVVPARRATIHSDFHGENILVYEDPVVIDFLGVADGPTPLDPVCLELSVLFHPHARAWPGSWPSEDQLANWADFDAYAAGAPFPRFLEACRRWAMDVARGNIDLHACRYAYVASQARFATSSETRLTALVSDLPALLT